MESDEENGDRISAQGLRQHQRAAPTSKPLDDIMPAIPVEDVAENSGYQVSPRSQLLNVISNTQRPTSLSSLKAQTNPEKFPPNTEETIQNPKPNPMKTDTHSPNTEKPTSLSASNTART